jgi:dephospho-CoA kinase
MVILGVTGAIGAGKSTLSNYFLKLGIPAHCADSVVHDLLSSDPLVQHKIKKLWPDVFVQGKIDRNLLGEKTLSSPPLLRQLEDILYPKLVLSQKKFLHRNQMNQVDFVVIDAPLLLEVGLDRYCHFVILTEAPRFLRQQRVLKRQGMTLKKFERVESNQMSDLTRRKYVNFTISTGRDRGSSLNKIQTILTFISKNPFPKWTGKWPRVLKREYYDKRNCIRHRNYRV